MHFVCWTLIVKRTLALPYFLSYVNKYRKCQVPRTYFATYMFQNKELLLINGILK